mgnify:FL=1
MTSSSLGLDYLPHDYEAEEFVLGACLISPDAIFKVLTSLRPDDFFNVNHQALFETMTDRKSVV